MAVVQKVMFVLYCVGAGVAGLAAFNDLISLFLQGKAIADYAVILSIVRGGFPIQGLVFCSQD